MAGKGPNCLFIAWTENGSVYVHCLREDGTLGAPDVGSPDCTADDGTDGVELWGECYSIENITELDLSSSDLSGEIPPEIGNLTNLTNLYLGSNQLSGEIPESICNLVENDCYIELGPNNLCPPYPECLTEDQIGEQTCAGPCSGCNPGAEWFSSDECTQWVTDINECNSGDLQVLENFIFQNSIDEETSMTDYDNGDGTFEALEMGEQIWVDGRITKFNPFGNWNNDPTEFSYGLTVVPENISDLNELKYLDLDNNQLETFPESFGDLSLLETLWLGRNPLEVIPESIFDLLSLSLLGVYETNISEIPPEIGNLTNLTYLWLNDNQLSGEIPSEIGNLTNLTYLDLRWNQLTGQIPESICDIDNIDWSSNSFYITNNQLCPPYPSCIEDYVGEQDTSGCAQVSIFNETLPITYNLYNAYPNPFNPVTTLQYDLPEDALVNITIYDMMGRVVSNLVSSQQNAGYKSIQWDATNVQGQPVSAGVYLYSIEAGEFRQTKKMILLK